MTVVLLFCIVVGIFAISRIIPKRKNPLPPPDDELSSLSADVPCELLKGDSGGSSSSTKAIVCNIPLSDGPCEPLDRTTYLAFSFEDKHDKKLERTEDRIYDIIDDLSEDPKKAESQYQKALKTCSEFKDWCLSQGEEGVAYYNYHVSDIIKDVTCSHEKFVSSCERADELSREYGFSVSYDDVDFISGYDDYTLSSMFYDDHYKEVDRKTNSIFSLIDNPAESPSSNLKRFEKALSMCDEFESWCCSTIGGRKYYERNGIDLRNTVTKFYDEYKDNYDSYVIAYKEKQAHKRELKKLQNEIILILRNNGGSRQRVDLIKDLPQYNKDDVLCTIESCVKSGVVSLSKEGNRIVVSLN